MFRKSIGMLTVLTASALWGCGAGDFEPNQKGGGASAGTGGSAAVGGSGGGGGEAGSCDPSANDAPDPDGVDENCDGADGTVDKDVYVNGNSGSDTNVGTPDAPLRTLEAAILVAQGRGGEVLVGNAEYEIAELGKSGDYSLHGGYGTSFSGSRKRELTVIVATSPDGVLFANAGAILLESLTVQGLDAEDATTTAHALRLDSASARLLDVLVIAGNGLAGVDGEDGADGAAGKNANGKYGASSHSCENVLQPTFANGAQAGSPNSQGAAAGNCPAKLPATQGKPGIPGSPGANASTTPSVESGLLSWNDGGTALDDAQPGFGGAGGGVCDASAQAGGGASGGCPGKPGTGGKSGGGSVAILLLSGSLALEGSVVRTGFAGKGGNGGAGGSGGPGGDGAKPSCPYYIDDCSTILNVCTPTSDVFAKNCALYGAAGGVGGLGGHGGGGIGGWTIGAVGVSGTQISYDAATTFELGSPGKGGEGSGNVRAPDGQKRKVLDLAAP